MKFLFSFRYENAFRIYSILFCVVVLIERYYFHESAYDSGPFIHSDFYTNNYIRVLLLLIPFIYSSFFHKTQLYREELKPNLPFLFLGFSTLALFMPQLIYFILFILSCFFVKGLRKLGFTGIGLFVAFFFFTPSFPGMMRYYYRPLQGSLKSNAHTFQTILETYAVDYEGSYPQSALTLEKIARKENYWKDFRNPITGKTGYKLSFSDISKKELMKVKNGKLENSKLSVPPKKIDVLGVRLNNIPASHGYLGGAILYYSSGLNTYAIYGLFLDDKLILDREIPFSLSNY